MTPQRTIKPSSSDENSRIIYLESQHKNIDKLFFTCGFFSNGNPHLVPSVALKRFTTFPFEDHSKKNGPWEVHL
jgi:hypothetical protein